MRSRSAGLLIVCLTLGLWSTSVSAQDDKVLSNLEAAFQSWAIEQGARWGAIAILHDGAPVSTKSFGRSPNDPVELASVSKSITAVCVLSLVTEGLLAWDDPVSRYISDLPERITVADLVTQTSGLVEDSSQGDMAGWLRSDEDYASTVMDNILERGGPQGPRGSFVYNNENYALLGLVISRVTGKPVSDTCAERVLAPAGVTGARSDLTGAFLSFGGWQMTPLDYAMFHAHWFGPQAHVGQNPFAFPHALVEGSAHYGLGVFFRPFGDHFNIWHFGLWCFPKGPNAGTFAVNWEGEWSVMAAYDGCHEWDAMLALDGALAQAVYDR